MLISIIINEKNYHFKEEVSILEACNSIGIKLPRFCYHENLSISGNCRMCLVELEKSLKPVVACSTEILNGMIIYTNSPLVLKARENVLELLLLNHPLDCPICDQGGECDLQDQAIFFGSSFSRNFFSKRSVEDKVCNNLIKTIMNRCIHCTRCVRFGEEICGVKFFGSLNRGVNTEIGNYIAKVALSDLSANVVDLCPVGALTLKTIPFQTRPWELQSLESLDLTDCLGSNIYILYKNQEILKIVPKKNNLINDSWISNKARFYFNLIYINKKFKQADLLNFTKPSLFLLNPDLDLKTLLLLKKLSYKNKSYSIRLLNSTSLKNNIYFWGYKKKINTIRSLENCICLFLASNLQIEASVLNIKLRAKIKLKKVKFYNLGFSFKSDFPLNFLKFNISEIIFLFLGKHRVLSKNFFNFNFLIFSNKILLNQLDTHFINFFFYKNIQIVSYHLNSFCNSECLNFLHLKKFNFKEFCFSKQYFGLNLDDTFLLRKLIFFNRNFFWVNQFSSNILLYFTQYIWIQLDINQTPGIYINLEQRPQKMFLLITNYKSTILKFVSNFLSYTLKYKPFFFNRALFKNITFFNYIFDCNSILEMFYYPFLNNNLLKNFNVLKIFFYYNVFFFYKNRPIKTLIEDPYRSSLQLKFVSPLIKSSQMLRLHDSI